MSQRTARRALDCVPIIEALGSGSRECVRFIGNDNEPTLPTTTLRSLDAIVLTLLPQAKVCVFAFMKLLPVAEGFSPDDATILGGMA